MSSIVRFWILVKQVTDLLIQGSAFGVWLIYLLAKVGKDFWRAPPYHFLLHSNQTCRICLGSFVFLSVFHVLGHLLGSSSVSFFSCKERLNSQSERSESWWSWRGSIVGILRTKHTQCFFVQRNVAPYTEQSVDYNSVSFAVGRLLSRLDIACYTSWTNLRGLGTVSGPLYWTPSYVYLVVNYTMAVGRPSARRATSCGVCHLRH